MPTFSRSGDYYCTSLVTGPSSAYVHIRFVSDASGVPKVTLVQPDMRYGNASDSEVAKSVTMAVAQANDRNGTSFHIAEICYQSDNDGLCSLIGRAAFLIASRLASHGEAGFDAYFQRCEHANERWKNVTERRCPQCSSLCPEYRKHCLACGYDLGRL